MGQGSCPPLLSLGPRYWRYTKRYYDTNKCVLANRDTSMYYYSMGVMVPENKNMRGLRYEVFQAIKHCLGGLSKKRLMEGTVDVL